MGGSLLDYRRPDLGTVTRCPNASGRTVRSEPGGAKLNQKSPQLSETSRPLLEEIVQQITGVQFVSLHSDISTRTGERIIVFSLTENLEARFHR